MTFFCRNHQGDTVARIIQRCRDFIAEHPSPVIQYRFAGGLIGMTAAANEEILRNDVMMNLLGSARSCSSWSSRTGRSCRRS